MIRINITDNAEELGKKAAEAAASLIRDAIEEKSWCRMVLSTGTSQFEFFSALVKEDIDWSRVEIFHLDEYVGLPENHAASFRFYLARRFVDKVHLGKVNYVNEGNIDEISALWREKPVDIGVIGIGENGHIAFNDPPVADFNDKLYVKVVELERKCREQQVHDGCFERIEDVPTHALTVTIPGLCSASWMYCSVPSRTKADAIYHVVNDDVSTACPATILKNRGNAFLYTDKEAASLIL